LSQIKVGDQRPRQAGSLNKGVPVDQFARRPTVLIVEDDLSLISAMTFALQADGLRVLAYSDGRELLAADRDRPADCLVVDYRLPGMNGLDVIAALRERGETAPAILITTNPDERCRRAAQAGGVSIVEKPLLDGELRRQIDAAVASRP
jgi:FixJ family two-component response regulator